MSALLSVDAKTGTDATNNHAFSQQLTLESSDLADIGQCEMNMVVKSDGYLDNDGVTTRYIPDQKYQFTATIEPCQTSLVNSPAIADMWYFLAEPAID